MSNRYYRIYEVDFDKFNIEITYESYEYCMNVSKNANFTLEEKDLNKLVDLLNSLGFCDLSEEQN